MISDYTSSAESLRERIISCRLCPRLVEFRESIEPRTAYASQDYWRKPVPGFGDLNGELLILGLAPARHGAERTGRIFTGDASSRFLVSALHSSGFANQPISESRDDGLVYSGCFVTAVVKCVPPGDRPAPSEFANCSRYLDVEVSLMKNLKGVLTLGSLAFGAYVDHLARKGVKTKGLKFRHGAVFRIDGIPAIYASYHPSPRNTNTGKLTQRMLIAVLKRIRRDLSI